MDKIERKRIFAATLEGWADSLRNLDIETWNDRDRKILERTKWDLKQVARAVRGTAATTKLSGKRQPYFKAGLFVSGTMKRVPADDYFAGLNRVKNPNESLKDRLIRLSGGPKAPNESLDSLIDRLSKQR